MSNCIQSKKKANINAPRYTELSLSNCKEKVRDLGAAGASYLFIDTTPSRAEKGSVNEALLKLADLILIPRGKRVASHQRSARPHRPTTVSEHMPSSHRRYRDWTHDRIRREAAMVGPNTAALADVILRSRPHPEQGFRSCIGVLGLVKRYGTTRVDAACARALVLGTRSYNSVAAILKNHRENAPPVADAPILIHENIRGPGYYH